VFEETFIIEKPAEIMDSQPKDEKVQEEPGDEA